MRANRRPSAVDSAPSARTSFDKLLSIRGTVRFAAAEPDVLREIGEESKHKGTDKLTSRQIDRVIAAARTQLPKRG